jgi:integrase
MPRFSPVKFNDKAVARMKPKPGRRVVFDAAEPGLGLRVGPHTRTWVFVYRAGDRVRFLKLGRYPDLTLAAARKAAREERVKVDQGTDPAAERQAVKLGETFGDLATDYLDKYAKKHKRSWAEDRRILNADLLPDWRDLKVREMTRRVVRERIEAIAERAPVMANRVWALVSRLFNYAIKHDWIDANPAALIDQQPEKSRDRVLSHDELRALWTALETDKALPMARVVEARDRVRRHKAPAEDTAPAARTGRVSPMIARGLEVLLLTAQRPGEVFQMRWQDLDLEDGWQRDDGIVRTGWWTIPEQFSKNREVHRVPLGAEVLQVLREAWAAAPVDNPWVFAGDAGGSVAARAKKAGATLSAGLGFSFHRHDLRRTASSEMGAAGIPRETIAKVLNHVDRGARMTKIYDRYSYDAEKRVALDTWARKLAGILEAAPGAVVPFARRK